MNAELSSKRRRSCLGSRTGDRDRFWTAYTHHAGRIIKHFDRNGGFKMFQIWERASKAPRIGRPHHQNAKEV